MERNSIFEFSSENVTPMTYGIGCDALESKAAQLARVRRRLCAAVARIGKSWQELFIICDQNRDGSLCWREMVHLIRDTLAVPATAVCESELIALFAEIDNDKSGTIDAAELLEYLQHGQRNPEEEAHRLETRMKRMHRNLRMAWQKVKGDEASVRSLFGIMDLDGSLRLSPLEFDLFVRRYLNLSRWDVRNRDLIDYYHQLDKDGDGIDVNELLSYIREIHKEKHLIGAQFLQQGGPNAGQLSRMHRRKPTYRQKLQEGMAKSSSLPSLGSHGFTCLGRERKPSTRFAASGGFL